MKTPRSTRENAVTDSPKAHRNVEYLHHADQLAWPRAHPLAWREKTECDPSCDDVKTLIVDSVRRL